MAIAIIIYIVFLLVFLIVSSLILRHAVKFSYLNPHFKYIVGIFSIIAFTVIIFSVYLLVSMKNPNGVQPIKTTNASSSGKNLSF